MPNGSAARFVRRFPPSESSSDFHSLPQGVAHMGTHTGTTDLPGHMGTVRLHAALLEIPPVMTDTASRERRKQTKGKAIWVDQGDGTLVPTSKRIEIGVLRREKSDGNLTKNAARAGRAETSGSIILQFAEKVYKKGTAGMTKGQLQYRRRQVREAGFLKDAREAYLAGDEDACAHYSQMVVMGIRQGPWDRPSK